jgi:hypothetical protein
LARILSTLSRIVKCGLLRRLSKDIARVRSGPKRGCSGIELQLGVRKEDCKNFIEGHVSGLFESSPGATRPSSSTFRAKVNIMQRRQRCLRLKDFKITSLLIDAPLLPGLIAGRAIKSVIGRLGATLVTTIRAQDHPGNGFTTVPGAGVASTLTFFKGFEMPILLVKHDILPCPHLG